MKNICQDFMKKAMVLKTFLGGYKKMWKINRVGSIPIKHCLSNLKTIFSKIQLCKWQLSSYIMYLSYDFRSHLLSLLILRRENQAILFCSSSFVMLTQLRYSGELVEALCCRTPGSVLVIMHKADCAQTSFCYAGVSPQFCNVQEDCGACAELYWL